jgi:hypothetical protein
MHKIDIIAFQVMKVRAISSKPHKRNHYSGMAFGDVDLGVLQRIGITPTVSASAFS